MNEQKCIDAVEVVAVQADTEVSDISAAQVIEAERAETLAQRHREATLRALRASLSPAARARHASRQGRSARGGAR